MPLSISSSDPTSSKQTMKKAWLFACVLIILVFGAWEGFWRMKGFFPAIEDDQTLWHLIRSRITTDTKTVFIGASRIQLGVHPDVFAQITGHRPLILAIDGNPPFSVLENLAEDPVFRGTLFCSIHPQWLAEPTPEKDRAAKWVRKYKPPTLLSFIELQLSLLIQKTFVFRYPGLSPSKLWQRYKQGRWPQPAYSHIRTDRYREAFFTPENTPGILASRIKRVKEFTQASKALGPEAFLERLSTIDRHVKKIRARGGQVIFIRMPSSGEVRALESKTWPRKTYWDLFAATVSGTMIHFEDYDSLKHFYCPDGSHMGVSDAKRFTRELINVLTQKKIRL